MSCYVVCEAIKSVAMRDSQEEAESLALAMAVNTGHMVTVSTELPDWAQEFKVAE